MKFINLATICFIIIVALPQVLPAEVIQLVTVRSETKKDERKQYDEKTLKEIQLIKNALVTFVKSPIKAKSKLVSSKYKNIKKNITRALSSAFGKESYSKIDLRKIDYFGEGRANAETNLYWAFEGYEGIQTFHFTLVKEKGQWLIDWIVY